jgi:HD-GYP domain-containing protein (c-di-GMP phosphodiesterase class II)
MSQQIMAASDAFAALTDDRPHREGRNMHNAIGILSQTASDGAIDPRLVDIFKLDLSEVDAIRLAA